MSLLHIEQTLTLEAPPGRVWRHLVDPRVVVECLPGAELTSSSDDGRTHEGTVKVKLGALTMAYRGTAEFIEVDDAARRLRIEAKGKERVGAGRVGMTLVSRVTETDGGSAVAVEVDIRLAGKIVSMGRSVVGVVTQQLIAEFADRLGSRLSEGDAPEATSDPGAEPSPGSQPVKGFSLLVRAARTGLRKQLSKVRGRADAPEPEPDEQA
jgi:carbon monoxide dehydrogenase subunit G